MTRRAERIASIRKKAGKISGGLDELVKNQEWPDYSCLNADELSLFVTLTRKAYDCDDLMHVAEHHPVKTFDLNRLTAAEQGNFQVLAERVDISQNKPLPP